MKTEDKRMLLSKLNAMFAICDKVATPELLQIYGSALKDKVGELLWGVLDEFAYKGGRLPSPADIVDRYNQLDAGRKSHDKHLRWSIMMDKFRDESLSPAAEAARKEAMAAINKLFG